MDAKSKLKLKFFSITPMLVHLISNINISNSEKAHLYVYYITQIICFDSTDILDIYFEYFLNLARTFAYNYFGTNDKEVFSMLENTGFKKRINEEMKSSVHKAYYYLEKIFDRFDISCNDIEKKKNQEENKMTEYVVIFHPDKPKKPSKNKTNN